MDNSDSDGKNRELNRIPAGKFQGIPFYAPRLSGLQRHESRFLRTILSEIVVRQSLSDAVRYADLVAANPETLRCRAQASTGFVFVELIPLLGRIMPVEASGRLTKRSKRVDPRIAKALKAFDQLGGKAPPMKPPPAPLPQEKRKQLMEMWKRRAINAKVAGNKPEEMKSWGALRALQESVYSPEQRAVLKSLAATMNGLHGRSKELGARWKVMHFDPRKDRATYLALSEQKHKANAAYSAAYEAHSKAKEQFDIENRGDLKPTASIEGG